MAVLTRAGAARPDEAPPAAETKYFTVPEAAKELKVGQRWLRDGFNHHGFPGARMGGGIVFDSVDLALIYALHRVPAQTPRKRRVTA